MCTVVYVCVLLCVYVCVLLCVCVCVLLCVYVCVLPLLCLSQMKAVKWVAENSNCCGVLGQPNELLSLH